MPTTGYPDLSRFDIGGVPPATPPPNMGHTSNSMPAIIVAPLNISPPPLFFSHRTPLSTHYPFEMAVRPSSPSRLHCYVPQLCQINPSAHPAPPVGGPVRARRGSCRWHKITSPVIGPPFQNLLVPPTSKTRNIGAG